MKKDQEPRSSSSCAACKFLKRRCSPTCIFAPHFRSDEPKKFAKVHKVFGASNVSKILVQVPQDQRDDAVNSLVYEAEARLRDPVYGCIGAIVLLQRKMAELHHDLAIAKTRLALHAAKSSSSSSPPPPAPPPPFLLLDDHLVMSPLSDLPVICNGWMEGFHQSGFVDELSQVPFP